MNELQSKSSEMVQIKALYCFPFILFCVFNMILSLLAALQTIDKRPLSNQTYLMNPIYEACHFFLAQLEARALYGYGEMPFGMNYEIT